MLRRLTTKLSDIEEAESLEGTSIGSGFEEELNS